MKQNNLSQMLTSTTHTYEPPTPGCTWHDGDAGIHLEVLVEKVLPKKLIAAHSLPRPAGGTVINVMGTENGRMSSRKTVYKQHRGKYR